MSCGVEFEKLGAMIDAKSVIDERGKQVTFYLNEETDIVRDKYNSISQRTKDYFTIFAFPVVYQPTRDSLEKAGVKEDCEVLITTSMQDWIDKGYNNKTISEIDNLRAFVDLNGERFGISEMGRINNFFDEYLNITFGLKRR